MSENNEEKVVKKTTARKTSPKTTTKKTTVQKKVVEDKKEMTLNDIPKELLTELTQQILSTINTQKETDTVKEEIKPKSEVTTSTPDKYTKAYLNGNDTIRKELIEVRSIYGGGVNFISNRTKIAYRWAEKGSIEYLTVEELLVMESSSLRFLHTPWLVVDDERIIEAFGLKKLYSVIAEVEDLETFLGGEINHIEEIVTQLPNEYKIELVSDIYKGLKDKTLRIDYIVLQKLQDLLHYDFME